MDNVKFLKANKKDQHAIIKLHSLLYKDDDTKSKIEIIDQVNIALKNRLIWVAKLNEKVVGYILCELFNEQHQYFPNSIFIDGFYVISRYRNRGIGKKLIAKAFSGKFPKEYKYFSLTHDPKMLNLNKYYKSFGFIEKGVTKAGNIMLIKNR